MLKSLSDRATRGKERNDKTVRDRMLGKEQTQARTDLATLLKVCEAIQNSELCFSVRVNVDGTYSHPYSPET